VDTLDQPSDNVPPDTDYGDMWQSPRPEANDTEFETFNRYIGAEIIINDNGKTRAAKMTNCACDNNGNPIGKKPSNPLLDILEYDCTVGE